MITRIHYFTLVLYLAAIPFAAIAQQSIFDELYRGDEPIEIEIEAALVELIENRRLEEPQPSSFVFENTRGQKRAFGVKLAQRGKYRRRTCEFPPFSLNFSKDELKQQGFIPKYDKLKLVTHCLDDKQVGQDLVLREYLSYKLFNELSSASYRVQLAKVAYLDSNREIGRIKRFGFLIEDTDEMALRLGGEECEDCINPPDSSIAASTENVMAVFQYMIGNADWSLPMMRNLKIITPFDGGGLIPVPYDFDFSGLVNAPYALPNSDYGLLSVKQRVFLGNSTSRADLEKTLKLFLTKKERMYEIIQDFKLLSWESRQEIQAYLESFFQEAESILAADDSNPEYQLLRQCVRMQSSDDKGAFNRPPGK